MPPEGFFNLLKPPGMSSHDVVAVVRAHLGLRRVGHLGTLDPAAAGVLPISVGRATRLFEFAKGFDKAYRAEIVFGISTDTLDAEGTVTGVRDCGSLTETRISELLLNFLGEIEQSPPAYSAAQVDGKRLYELARRGKVPIIRPKRVSIHALTLVSFQPGERARALIDIECGAGTYIRALASDLGEAAGCGAHLAFLVRTRVGRFELSEALTLEEFEQESANHLLPMDWPIEGLPEIRLERNAARTFTQGTLLRQVAETSKPGTQRGFAGQAPADVGQYYRIYGPDDQFLGIGAILSERSLRPHIVLAAPKNSGNEIVNAGNSRL